MVNFTELWQAYQKAVSDLLAERTPAGHWEGRLASSALATATAIGALALVRQKGGPGGPETDRLIAAGLQWLARSQNPDGGWGDTDRSPSNIATTMLVRAAVHLADRLYIAPSQGAVSPADPLSPFSQKPTERFAHLLERAARYIELQGGLECLRRRYGKDQTFAVPILTMYALAGLVGWQEVRPLPFEWAVLPHQVLGWVRLPVVSYAIPALVAMGQARFFHLPPRNPLLRWLRRSLVEKTLQVLEAKQPRSGGFLEAVPLTSFVAMALASTQRANHPVVHRAVDFLIRTYRPEGAWPIDVNLATWVTTLSLNALLGPGDRLLRCGPNPNFPSDGDFETGFAELAARYRETACSGWPWLLACQHQKIHPFTHSAPGGWGWTNLDGAVPDSDDTAGALLALAAIYRFVQEELSPHDRRRIVQAAAQGLRWLMDLQNRDGGWPTFCRGWGALPFDRSGTDLTAHALRALGAWKGLIAQGALTEEGMSGQFPVSLRQIQRAIHRGLRYLESAQNPDGSWTPLWFGNVYWPREENPIYGTARVVLAYRDLGQWHHPAVQRGCQWLLTHQNPDGGWGGHPLEPSQTPPHQTDPPPESPETSFSARVQQTCQPTQPGQFSRPMDWQSSVEETALALEALLADPQVGVLLRQRSEWKEPSLPVPPVEPKFSCPDVPSSKEQTPRKATSQAMLPRAIERALGWLMRAVQEGRHQQPEPIGLYFARLWYYENLYPLVFTVSTLGQAICRWLPQGSPKAKQT